MILTNSVIITVATVLGMSIAKLNVVIALTTGALIGGIWGGLGLTKTLEVFTQGLSGGAEVALSYAILGAFAVAVAHSGVPIWLSQKMIKWISSRSHRTGHSLLFKTIIILLLGFAGIMSQNVFPVHIAFIPILIPPLLGIFTKLQIDRRLLSNVMASSMILAYSTIPCGFGKIFLENILLKNMAQNGLNVALREILPGLVFPVLGMVVGLITSCWAYRKPRLYISTTTESVENNEESCSLKNVIVSGIAIVSTFMVQILYGNMIAGALVGLYIFTIGGVVHWRKSDDIVTQGFRMMSSITFILIAASGLAAVLKETGDIQELVNGLVNGVGSSKILAAFGMVMVGLLITMGIGSSFSTVPIIAAIYIPLCATLGFSHSATVCIMVSAAITGDAGSPSSDTMLGMTAGLNADGQHNHITDTTIPGFIHFNIPLVIFGTLGALVL